MLIVTAALNMAERYQVTPSIIRWWILPFLTVASPKLPEVLYDILLLECVGVWQHASTSLVSISCVHKFNYCVVPEIQLFSMFPSSDCTSSLVYWKETTVIQELPNMCHYFA